MPAHRHIGVVVPGYDGDIGRRSECPQPERGPGELGGQGDVDDIAGDRDVIGAGPHQVTDERVQHFGAVDVHPSKSPGQVPEHTLVEHRRRCGREPRRNVRIRKVGKHEARLALNARPDYGGVDDRPSAFATRPARRRIALLGHTATDFVRLSNANALAHVITASGRHQDRLKWRVGRFEILIDLVFSRAPDSARVLQQHLRLQPVSRSTSFYSFQPESFGATRASAYPVPRHRILQDTGAAPIRGRPGDREHRSQPHQDEEARRKPAFASASTRPPLDGFYKAAPASTSTRRWAPMLANLNSGETGIREDGVTARRRCRPP